MAALLPAVARIARSGRTRITWLVAVTGGVLVADLAFAAALWFAVPASGAQRAYAPAWLPVSLGMNELGLPSGFHGPGAQNAACLLQYPLIGVTAFTVALAVALGRRPATG